MFYMKVHRGISLLENVFLRVKISPETCWEWQGQRDKDGYGVLTVKGKPMKIHRYVYKLAYGDTKEALVLHHCDNPPCVKPSHLFSGSIQDNTKDMIRKGRTRYVRGEEVGSHYLTATQVFSIRKDYEKSDKSRGTAINIAKKYNLSPNLVRRIIRRERWSWL